MTDLDKTLKMLKSPKAFVRYEACEELRIATRSNPEVIIALEEATQDDDEGVAVRARKAPEAEVHQRMAIKMGRLSSIPESKSVPEVVPEPEQPVKLLNKDLGSKEIRFLHHLYIVNIALSNTSGYRRKAGDELQSFGVCIYYRAKTSGKEASQWVDD